jgi:hypothetical protein
MMRRRNHQRQRNTETTGFWSDMYMEKEIFRLGPNMGLSHGLVRGDSRRTRILPPRL